MKRIFTRSTLSKLGLIIALPLLSYALYTIPVDSLIPETLKTVASATVSLSAGVAANPYNTAAEQLKAKEAELTVRENRLTMKETVSDNSDTLAIYSLLMSLALFILVGLNFFFDWRRSKREVAVVAAPSYLSLDLRRK